jgi:hypothetical protein
VASAVDHCQWTYLIMRCPELFAGHADLADLLGARAETPDELNAELSASFQSLLVEQQIISARRSIRDPDLRFLLALLLNIADRAEILRLVAAYAGSDDPVNAVAGWVVRLALYRGDPRERLARLAVAAAADHRIGVNLRALLPADLTHEDMQALLERALCVVPDADPAIQRTRGALATHPVFRALLPVASN